MCYTRKSSVSDAREKRVENDRATEVRAKRAGLIGALIGAFDKPGQKADSDRASAKENVPAE